MEDTATLQNTTPSLLKKREVYKTDLSEQIKIATELRDNSSSAENKRLLRFLSLPDLTRKPESPIFRLADMITSLPEFKNFDIVETPEVVHTNITFDLFNFPQEHPARSGSDTYYINKERVLRTHTTIMWYYYFTLPEIREKLQKQGALGALSYGKVYRKDEIDRFHNAVFHQIDGVYICDGRQKKIGKDDLVSVLIKIAKSVFGESIQWRENVEHYPYTNPSVDIELKFGERWLEVLGGGVIHPDVLRNLHIDPTVYSGWAFGFGLERLAMIKHAIPDIRIFWSTDERITKQLADPQAQYHEVSKYPAIVRDISFVVDKKMDLNNYYGNVRDLGGETIEEVRLLDTYESDEKFGLDKKSYTFRITYRSLEKTLTDAFVNSVHQKICEFTARELLATVR